MSLGMLGQTNWYYRHRDEKAKVRIMTTPRVAHRLKARPTSTAATATTPITINEDVKAKLEALKARLREKQTSVTTTAATLSYTSSAISSTGASSTKVSGGVNGFTRFMNRNSTLVN